LIVLVYFVVAASGAYINNYDAEFFFKCKPNQFVNHIASVHDNGAEDRRFEMTCKDVLPESEGGPPPHCIETGKQYRSHRPTVLKLVSIIVIVRINTYTAFCFTGRR